MKGEGMNGSGGLVWENDDPKLYACASQPLTLEPGKAYRFGAHVKIDSIETGANARAGAFVCIEWSNADGKWMGGSYTEHLKVSQTDWTRTATMSIAYLPSWAAVCRPCLPGVSVSNCCQPAFRLCAYDRRCECVSLTCMGFNQRLAGLILLSYLQEVMPHRNGRSLGLVRHSGFREYRSERRFTAFDEMSS